MLLYNASATHTFAGITGLTRGTVAAWGRNNRRLHGANQAEVLSAPQPPGSQVAKTVTGRPNRSRIFSTSPRSCQRALADSRSPIRM